ncbi:hypothetical protein NDU88_000026 [Pleurodeles waltl]|uniref:Large ribosomal subunit protein uL30 N-terminal eukaryotes domain-containing protein n=1 Tax=Pleurodeles waltl TaxID=8319 RepID=A0AAV7R7H7_PLEWA|nr:hypothetical protein NDU88_000026 [Pleurodeles waltl]
MRGPWTEHGCKMEAGEPKRKIPLVPENLLKKRKAYQAIKATQAKLALQEKKRVSALMRGVEIQLTSSEKGEYRRDGLEGEIQG